MNDPRIVRFFTPEKCGRKRIPGGHTDQKEQLRTKRISLWRGRIAKQESAIAAAQRRIAECKEKLAELTG